jgi:hypothetical protein
MQADDVASRRSAQKAKGRRGTRHKPKKSKLAVETVEPGSEDVGQSGGNMDSDQVRPANCFQIKSILTILNTKVANTASGSKADKTAGEPSEPTRAHSMATRSRGRVKQEVEEPSLSDANDSDDFDFLAPLLQKKESGGVFIYQDSPDKRR